MAEIYKWESSTQYDDELRKIEHYENHPELLPFIGTNYNYTRILLIGESHYIQDLDKAEDKFIQYYKNGWYVSRICEGFPDQLWFNTRIVVHNFLVLRRGKGHSMFGNSAKEMVKAWSKAGLKLDSEAFDACAFMNYFQRPASSQGNSICNSDEDNRIALNTLNEVIEIIKPLKVIFLSKKAYKAYTNYNNGNSNPKVEMFCVTHPTCPHWNKSNGKNYFNEIVSRVHPKINFPKHVYFEKDYIEKQIKQKTNYIIVDRKILRNEKNIQILSGDGQQVNEIVVRTVTDNNRKIGIGYRFDYRMIWVWDYDKKDYLDSISDDENVKKFYEEFVDFIKAIQ